MSRAKGKRKPTQPANMLHGALPTAWVRHAEKLRRSAEILWVPIELAITRQPPLGKAELELWDHIYAFLLVAGAALEAILKAAAMQARLNSEWSLRAVVTPDWSLQPWVLTHDLDKYAAIAGIELSEDEATEMARFERYVVWRGSYPVPTDLVDPRSDHLLTLDFHTSNLNKVWFDQLYERASNTYKHHAHEHERLQKERAEGSATPEQIIPPDEASR